VTIGNSSNTSFRFWGDLKPGGSSAGTSGQALLSAGAGASPTWGNVITSAGGTLTGPLVFSSAQVIPGVDLLILNQGVI
jgi:hypothetical protein